MCGICGWLVRGNQFGKDESRRIIQAMCDRIKHRGPDGQGEFVGKKSGAAIGHQRLSIIDAEGGAQPFSNHDGTVHLTFNGEIYNHHELRNRLAAKGVRFATRSDTEVLLEAYIQWGDQCVEYLNGMFAFAIWDENQNSFFCARDRLGIKPFYYYWDGSNFVFSSEIKSILAHPTVLAETDEDAFISYLAYQYIPSPKTIYRNVFKLPSAHTLRVRQDYLETTSYWHIEEFCTGENDYAADPHLYQDLLDAVGSQMESDVPLGAFLSGGVDSTTVVGLMSQLSTGPVRSQTATFNDSEFDESEQAYQVAHHLKCDYHETPVTMNILDDMESILFHLDEPFADASVVPTYYLCREAAKSLKVCLSGDGGDEIFAGYNWYNELLRHQIIDRFIPASMRGGFGNLGSLFPETARGRTFFNNLGVNSSERHRNLVRCFTSTEMRDYTGLDSHRLGQWEDPLKITQLFHDHVNDPVKSAQITDIKTYLADDILMKVDKMSMAHGLEVRVPLLDHRLMEKVMKIPTSGLINRAGRKIELKQAIRRIVPRSLIQNKKQGFDAPVAHWLRNDLKELTGDMLLSSNTRAGNTFNQRKVASLWKRLEKGEWHTGIEQRIWTMLVFEVWRQTN